MSITTREGAEVASSAPLPNPGLPRLNEPAPDFEARTTHGMISLADYRGRWLVLFSHPADFTPVCTTEFLAFSRAHEAFQKRNAALLGLSIDSVFAHLAWTQTIKEKFGETVPFPIIEDIDMHVSARYGMVHAAASTTQAVRALFVIDDKGIMRAMIYYPLSNGRSIPEVLRLLDALQTSDAHGVATPEGWQPGDDVIVPPPKTEAEREERLQAGYDCTDWFFCKKRL